jgi:poly(A) polymerase
MSQVAGEDATQDMQQENPPAGPGAPPIPLDRIDPDARAILERLGRAGFTAYLVGGCVRDLLLGRRPKDFDIATSARPRQVRRLFRNCMIIGRRFRLAHIRFGPRIFEVSTFRAPPERENAELDPLILRDNVYGTEVEDAFRRDFTVNGLFYDPLRGRLVDHVGGQADLRDRLIRTIGDPEVRLREDPVRILRAAKFAARLGFELTPELRAATESHREDLRKSAPPRVLEELYRLVSGEGSAEAFRLLDRLGALPVILPEICPPPDWFYAALGRVAEATGGARDGLPQGILLGVLLAPRALPAMEAIPSAHDHERALEAELRPLAHRLVVARADFTRARQCLAAQMRLRIPPLARGDRRFAHHESFGDALALRRLLGPLGVGESDPIAQWEEMASRRESHSGEEHRGGGRRRRRRHRGGRRRRGPLSGTAGDGTGVSWPSPTG